MFKTRSFTPKTADAIVAAVRAGNYANVAAAAAGIHRSAYFAWMNRGEAASDARSSGDRVDDTELAYADFHDRVRQADAEAEMTAVASVREAKGGWQAHMTYLKRRFPVRWRRMDGIKHSAGRVDETPTPEAEFRQMAEASGHRRHSAGDPRHASAR
jgi:hypothetical protein